MSLAAFASLANSADVTRLEAGERGEGYYVNYEATLQANAAAVMAVLTDYPNYPLLDARIREAQVISNDAAGRVLRTRLVGCLGSVFCRSMERIELLQESPDRLVATAIPERGDLVYGRTETRVEPTATGCRVIYSTEFQPTFWMPRWLVRRAMHATLWFGTREMFETVEARAAAP